MTIKTQLPKDSSIVITCHRCSETVTPPFIMWNLADYALTLCLDCSNVVSRGIFREVQVVLDIEDKQRHTVGKRHPITNHHPQFITSTEKR